ncbi:YihY/virulence factor BrkB family protein [Parabacteroides sp. PF5-9]|uniref:YihY/virulence factor BrkB family protein n=1 Tax=Parabacteroides sp. PF5-9 TaxID=1742404 RepID=UPI0024748463|nr:YihY/virulence factor BrkB family protein [Parabacteroides sp. PF5-9]MDH6358446.1 membrane protein [Parabacteroides sp. PF5-9]
MGRNNKKESKPSFFEQISSFISKAIHFITYDIWRITGNEVSGIKELGINTIKTILLAVRSFNNENLQSRASALTYSTLLAIVPMLAVLLGIARGFGFQDIVRNALGDYFPGHDNELNKAFEFVDGYLTQAQGGLIVGIGVILLLYTVVNLISNIEDTFNDIWQINKSRSIPRKVTDYLALFLIIPVLMTASSGISIFISSLQNTILDQFVFLTPFVDAILKTVPFVIASLVFAGLYIFLPNTKVRFLPGLMAGIVAGCAFQIFQYIYISGQIWVTKYNAIYGSFAAIPLLLLWLQLSWLICLFGGALAYGAQNVGKFSFEKDSKNISRRYKDFIFVLITSLIVKRFEKGEKPYTADELSETYHIPIRLTTEIVYTLTELHILTEVIDDKDEWVIYYQPAIDINQISVAYLLNHLDQLGSENFKIDKTERFNPEWRAVLKVREDMFHTMGDILLKDL